MIYDAWGGSWGSSWALSWTGEHNTPPVPPTPVIPTNPIYSGGATRGRQYIERLSKREEWEERLLLGILPAALEEAETAVIIAARATNQIEATQSNVLDRHDAQAVEQAARDAYAAVYREYLRADEIAEQFRLDVAERRNQIRRAAASILLLH